MRNMLALLGFAVVAFFGLGYYLGWYTLAVQPGKDGKQHIEFDVDTHKIAADAKKAGAAVGEAIESKVEAAPSTKPTTAQPAVGLGPDGALGVKLPNEINIGGVKVEFPKK